MGCGFHSGARVGWLPLLAASVMSIGPLVTAASLPATTQPSLAPIHQKMWINHIQPILSRSCFKCHGGERQKGGLDLREPNSIFAGGTDGAVVVPGKPGESQLYQRLMTDSDDHMPPHKEAQLSA